MTATSILGYTQATVENQFGVSAVNQWSNPSGYVQGVTQTNQQTLQQAMSSADSYILSRFFTAGNYSVPLQPGTNAAGSVQKWWAIICGYELYTARGLRDEKQGGNLKLLYDQACAEIQFFAAATGSQRLDASQRWPTADSPTTY